MNEDQVMGALIKFAGKAQESFGDLIGSKVQTYKGKRKQNVGDAQRNYGQAVEAVKNARSKKLNR